MGRERGTFLAYHPTDNEMSVLTRKKESGYQIIPCRKRRRTGKLGLFKEHYHRGKMDWEGDALIFRFTKKEKELARPKNGVLFPLHFVLTERTMSFFIWWVGEGGGGNVTFTRGKGKEEEVSLERRSVWKASRESGEIFLMILTREGKKTRSGQPFLEEEMFSRLKGRWKWGGKEAACIVKEERGGAWFLKAKGRERGQGCYVQEALGGQAGGGLLLIVTKKGKEGRQVLAIPAASRRGKSTR